MSLTNEQAIAFIKRNPISVGCGLVALVLGAATFYRSSGLPEAVALLEEKSREGNRLATNLRNGALLPDQLAELNTAAKSMEERFVRGSELAQNLQYFYRLEAETSLKLEVRQNPPSASAKSAPGSLGGVGFSLSAQGEYRAVLDFVRRLENGAHYCRVLSSSLNGSGPDRTGPVQLSLEIELFGQP